MLPFGVPDPVMVPAAGGPFLQEKRVGVRIARAYMGFRFRKHRTELQHQQHPPGVGVLIGMWNARNYSNAPHCKTKNIIVGFSLVSLYSVSDGLGVSRGARGICSRVPREVRHPPNMLRSCTGRSAPK